MWQTQAGPFTTILSMGWIFGRDAKHLGNKARILPDLMLCYYELYQYKRKHWLYSDMTGFSEFGHNPDVRRRRTPPLLHWKIRFQERSSFQLLTLSQDWWFITEQSRENTDSQPSRVPRELTKLLLTHNWKRTFVNLLNLTSAPSSAKCLPLNSPPPPSSFLWLMFKRSAVRQCAKQAIVPRISEGLLEVTTN